MPLIKSGAGGGYPVNVTLPGMLHGKLLRSSYAHARILSIDTTEAEKLPGVKAILTPDDVPKKKFNPIFFMPVQGHGANHDMQVLSDVVRYAGQPVAAVAATSIEIAAQALELIDVEYEELPALFSAAEAMAEGAPALHDYTQNNIAKHPFFETGDVDAALADADRVFEHSYQTQRVHTCYMEPRLVVVESDATGNLTVHSSNQHLFGLREKLAFVLDIPESKIRVIKPPYMGGGFGGKLDLCYNRTAGCADEFEDRPTGQVRAQPGRRVYYRCEKPGTDGTQDRDETGWDDYGALWQEHI